MCSSLFLHAQKDAKDRNFQFGIEVGGQVVGAEFVPGLFIGNNFNRRYVEWGGSLFVTKKLSDRFRVKTGIGYKYNSLTEMWRGLIAGSDIDPITGQIIDPLDLDNKLKSHYLSIPIAILWRVGDSAKIEFGVEIEYFVAGVKELDFNRPPTDLFLGTDLNKQSPLLNWYLGYELELFDLVFVKPFANLRLKDVWQLGGGIRLGKTF